MFTELQTRQSSGLNFHVKVICAETAHTANDASRLAYLTAHVSCLCSVPSADFIPTSLNDAK